MGETADDIKRQVENARARLGRNLNELEYHVKAEFDWRVQFDRHPWAFIGAAFSAAMLLGLLVTGGSRSTEPTLR